MNTEGTGRGPKFYTTSHLSTPHLETEVNQITVVRIETTIQINMTSLLHTHCHRVPAYEQTAGNLIVYSNLFWSPKSVSAHSLGCFFTYLHVFLLKPEKKLWQCIHCARCRRRCSHWSDKFRSSYMLWNRNTFRRIS